MTTTLLVPDVSEWQGPVDWSALVNGGYPAAIIRVYNGVRADHQYARNRDQAHAHGVRALGLYAYLQSGVDIEQQARDYVSLVGSLRPGEWPIVDYEAAHLDPNDAVKWIAHVGAALHGSAPWLYAGEYVFRSEHLDRVVPASRTWLAAYGTHEPAEGHVLWQYTDHRTVPGVTTPVDCSQFHGTLDQLLAAVATRRRRRPRGRRRTRATRSRTDSGRTTRSRPPGRCSARSRPRGGWTTTSKSPTITDRSHKRASEDSTGNTV
jgi:GH25 family lysozyme M1 (1,4-beta-N-acetylmuramidase)